MKVMNAIRCFGAAGLLTMTAMPASAQFADFFCSTFSIGCPPPPPPPPPVPVAVEPAPAPVKKAHRHRVVKKKAAAAKAAEETQ